MTRGEDHLLFDPTTAWMLDGDIVDHGAGDPQEDGYVLLTGGKSPFDDHAMSVTKEFQHKSGLKVGDQNLWYILILSCKANNSD